MKTTDRRVGRWRARRPLVVLAPAFAGPPVRGEDRDPVGFPVCRWGLPGSGPGGANISLCFFVSIRLAGIVEKSEPVRECFFEIMSAFPASYSTMLVSVTFESGEQA